MCFCQVCASAHWVKDEQCVFWRSPDNPDSLVSQHLSAPNGVLNTSRRLSQLRDGGGAIRPERWIYGSSVAVSAAVENHAGDNPWSCHVGDESHQVHSRFWGIWFHSSQGDDVWAPDVRDWSSSSWLTKKMFLNVKHDICPSKHLARVRHADLLLIVRKASTLTEWFTIWYRSSWLTKETWNTIIVIY